MRNDGRELQHFDEVAMSSPVYSADRGKNFGRYALALAKSPGGDLPSALGYASAQFGEHSAVTTVLRAAVAGGTTTGATWAGSLSEYATMQNEFLELVRPRSVISQLNLRAVPLNVRVLRELDGAVGYWVGQGAPKPLTSTALETVALPSLKLVGMAVLTEDVLRLGPAQAESIVTNILARAVAQVGNEAFLSDAAEVSGISPAGILSAATIIPATGDAVVDLAALIEAYVGDFASAAFIMRPSTAVQLAMLGARSGSTTFVDIGAKGGQLFGIPCVTSTGVPQGDSSGGGYIILLDTQAILLGAGAVEIMSARSASMEMLTNPTNNSATGTATSHVSMFQTNSVSLRVTRALNWKVSTFDSVAAVSNANYTSA